MKKGEIQTLVDDRSKVLKEAAELAKRIYPKDAPANLYLFGAADCLRRGDFIHAAYLLGRADELARVQNITEVELKTCFLDEIKKLVRDS